MEQILITYDIENTRKRNAFRNWLEEKGFEYVQDSVYNREFQTEDEVSKLNNDIIGAKGFFNDGDDVRMFRFDSHWHPIERERIRFFEG